MNVTVCISVCTSTPCTANNVNKCRFLSKHDMLPLDYFSSSNAVHGKLVSAQNIQEILRCDVL